MSLPTEVHPDPKTILTDGSEPEAASTKQSSSKVLAGGKSNANIHTNREGHDVDNDQLHLKVQERFKIQMEQIFGKCFFFQKYTTPDTWCLPDANELCKEYYQLENLQEMRIKLNQVKSKLNNYVIEDWSQHTRRQDPAGEIPWRLKTKTNAEFVTVAWCKMYECLGRFPELTKGSELNSLHLCEAPGAFITALNHFLHTNYEEKKVKWNWLATTLNPYYEGNPVNRMIMDDRFLLYTLDNWIFHKDFTGNIIDRENLQHMQQECEKRLGQVHLITADGSIDCTESPDCQEDNVALLNLAEIITALMILSEGGSFIVKMFTMYEASTVCKLFLLNCAFERVHVFKPCTSKRGNSEVYVVCLNYKKQTRNLSEILDKMILNLNLQNPMLWPLFPKSALPVDFLTQHEICCRIFMNHQISAIEQNIYSYEVRPHKATVKLLQSLRSAVCNEFYRRYNISTLPDELKILNNFTALTRKYCNQIYKGSHSEREMLKETSKEEKIFKLRKHLNELEKTLATHLPETNIDNKFQGSVTEDKSNISLKLYRGQGIATLNSSLFATVQLLIMRTKLNELFSDAIDDCLWLQNPRVEFCSDQSLVSINFNDFAATSEKFCHQQELFFKQLVSKLLEIKPNEVKFINMAFLTHYAVSILRYLSELVFSRISFSMDSDFEIVLSTCSPNFMANLEELKMALSSSEDHDILCVVSILHLHRNNFNETLCAFNNNLLLQNFKYLLNN